MEKCYTVAETVKMTGVKSYVLRYWEDELDLHIGRNELGHRYYTGEDIQLFLNIKELKNRGLQLRAIHDLLPKIARRDMSEPKGEAEASGIQLLESALPDKNKEQDEEMFKERLDLTAGERKGNGRRYEDPGIPGNHGASDHPGTSRQKRRGGQVAFAG